jgi:hypothetical protein
MHLKAQKILQSLDIEATKSELAYQRPEYEMLCNLKNMSMIYQIN